MSEHNFLLHSYKKVLKCDRVDLDYYTSRNADCIVVHFSRAKFSNAAEFEVEVITKEIYLPLAEKLSFKESDLVQVKFQDIVFFLKIVNNYGLFCQGVIVNKGGE